MTGPEISAIVVVGGRRERAGGCVRSLLAQGLGERLELLLVDLAAPDAAPVPGSHDPCVRVLPLPADTVFACARAAAARAARAPVVAFVEEHVRVLPGWAEGLLEAHRGPWAGVGGVVQCANPGVGRSSAVHQMSYGLFTRPKRGEVSLLPGPNASYKTAALLAYGDELDTLLICDLVLQQRLVRDGQRLLMEPRVRIAHLDENTLASFGRGMFLFNRQYGPLRARLHEWSLARRLFYVTAAPAIPFYALGRMLLSPGAAGARGSLLRDAAFILAAQACGAFGQAVGLAFGPGDAARSFTSYELHEERRTAAPEA